MKSVYVLLLSLFLFACDGSSTTDPLDPADNAVVQRIDIPFREHGYHQFNNTVIADTAQLQAFISKVESQDHWNEKEDFINVLTNATIQFDTHNLILFRMTEGSGSISLAPQPPLQSDADNIVLVDIDRQAPDIGTSDMAYYALAYSVSKAREAIHFTVGEQVHIIANMASDSSVPLNCLSWFDGCNTCQNQGRKEDNLVACTLKLCASMEEFRCLSWES